MNIIGILLLTFAAVLVLVASQLIGSKRDKNLR